MWMRSYKTPTRTISYPLLEPMKWKLGTKKMNVISIYRYARISAFKAREVTREIQGLPVATALDIVAFSPKKAAVLVAKTLKSAVANAENNNSLRADTLVVREAVVGEGPTLKRFTPKARGSAGPIRKRTSHIRIVLTDEIEIKTRETRKTTKPAGKKSTGGAKKTTARKSTMKSSQQKEQQPDEQAAKQKPAEQQESGSDVAQETKVGETPKPEEGSQDASHHTGE